MPAIKIGSRSSAMALAQTNLVCDRLAAAHGGPIAEIARFKPHGDRDQTSRLDVHGGKGGAFVAEIRDAIREGWLQAAMHSLKDMPGDEETPGLVIGAVLKREAVEDALIMRPGLDVAAAAASGFAGLKIGTNSVRRAAFLKRDYPALEIAHFRGAVDTRLRKLDEGLTQKLPDGGEVGPVDAIIVAKSGLERLGLDDRISMVLDPARFIPAIGQGVVAVECGARDWETRAKLAEIDDPETRKTIEAEREMLWILNGHCNAPIAGRAEIDGQVLTLRGAVCSLDGSTVVEASATGPAERPREVGRRVGLDLIERGAAGIIEEAAPSLGLGS